MREQDILWLEAAPNGNVDRAKIILDRGANVDIKDRRTCPLQIIFIIPTNPELRELRLWELPERGDKYWGVNSHSINRPWV